MDIYSDDPPSGWKPGKTRTIHLHRRPGIPYFGFGIRGGREYGLGFFVTKVVPGSESEQQGLLVGDQVIRIDGMRVEEALHKEMLNFIRSKTHVTLSVRSGGLVPFYECTNHALSWQSVGKTDHNHPVLSASVSSWNAVTDMAPSFASLTLRSDSKGRFGCSVCEGPPHRRGVYIQSTEEGSVARVAGMKAGDRILHCNGMDMTSLDFDEAVSLLKESTVLNLIISRGAGSDFISPGESSGYNSAASSINGDQSPLQNGKQKRLSVVREEMIDVIDERRGMVVGTATVDFQRRRNDHSGRNTVLRDWNRSSIGEDDDDDVEQEERKRLQEERQRIQEAHKLLNEEKEKLARDRQQLEDARIQLLNGPIATRKTIQPTNGSRTEPVVPAKAAVTVHEQLMEEFRQKMGSLKSAVNVNPSRPKSDLAGNAKPVSSPENHTHHSLKSSLSAPVAAPSVPPPPPLPATSLTGNRKKPAPPPPVPVPDYDCSLPVRRVMKQNGEMDPIELRSKTEGVKPTTTSSGPRISIGTYQELRPEPTKLDFLPPKRHSGVSSGEKSPSESGIKNQLQTELNQTLSRARLRQRNSDTDDVPSPPPPPSVVSKEMAAPVMSTFGRSMSIEMQAKMASLAVAASTSTISQSSDNKVTIKVQPYVPRSDTQRQNPTTYIDNVPVTEL